MKKNIFDTFLSAPSFEVEALVELKKGQWWGILVDPDHQLYEGLLPVKRGEQWLRGVIQKLYSEEMKELQEKEALWITSVRALASSEYSLWELESEGFSLYTIEIEGELQTRDSIVQWREKEGMLHVKIKEIASFSFHSFTTMRLVETEWGEDSLPIWGVSFVTAPFATKLSKGAFLYGPYTDILLGEVDWRVFELPYPALYSQRVNNKTLFLSRAEAELLIPLIEEEVEDSIEQCIQEAKEIVGDRELLPPKGPLFFTPELEPSKKLWVIKEGLNIGATNPGEELKIL